MHIPLEVEAKAEVRVEVEVWPDSTSKDLSGPLLLGIGSNKHRPPWPEGEPEAGFEPNSYFRSGRSRHDATRAIHISINGKARVRNRR